MTRRPKLAAIGEILWDVFPDGPRFGGAPANFACSVAGLGAEDAEVFMVSGVGRDDLGQLAVDSLEQHSVDTSCVSRLEQPTGQVLVEIDAAGKATYEFAADTAWDNLDWSNDLRDLAGRTDAMCFGTLGQRSDPSRATIRQFVTATRAAALRIFDINLRPPFYSDAAILESLTLANVLKLNDEELPVVATLCGLSGSPIEIMRQLADRFALAAVALTQGAKGAVILSGEILSEQPGVSTEVVDTVGAGDAFTAALALGLLAGDSLDAINRHACRVAAFVCSQAGATPAIPSQLRRQDRESC